MDWGQASEVLGLSVPVLRFLVSFAATVPVSWAWRLLPRGEAWAWARHLYAAGSGLLLSHAAFGWQALLLCSAPVVVSYVLMVLWRQRCGGISFFLAFVFLLACHVHFMSGDAWKKGGIDATGALMVMTLKVIAAAINYQDGLLPVEGLRDAQKRNRLEALPNPLAYAGFCFCCGTHLAGPVYELKDYLDWTHSRGLWSGTVVVPSPYRATLRAFARATFCMLLFMYLTPLFPLSMLSGEVYGHAWSWWRRFTYLWMCGFTARWKYYFIWSLSEAAVTVSTFGFSGWSEQGEAKWDRACNVHIRKVEFAGSGAEIPLYWNIHVGNWLRCYVYERLSPGQAKKRGFAVLLATQVVSAVWHGLYAGYFLFFVHTALMIAGSRVIYKWQLAFQGNSKDSSISARAFLSWLLGAAFASFVLHYSCIGFLLLSGSETIAAYRSMYFSGTLLPILVILSSHVVKPPPPPARINASRKDQ